MPFGPACQVVVGVSGSSVCLPASRTRVVLPCPSSRGRSTSGVSCGSDLATIAGVAALIHDSNSGLAAVFRDSTAVFADGSSFSSAANRDRSSSFGTGRIGGVS